MADFDPYRKWLGIPPEEQPADHYRLLGIARFESDPDVISNAADRQMVHVRSFQSGKFSALSQKILNELSTARVCLLDPAKRKAYDAELRKRTSSGHGAPPPVPPPGQQAMPRVETAPAATATGRRTYTTRRKKTSWQGPAITAGIILATLVIAVWGLSRSSDPPKSPPKPTQEAPKRHRRTVAPRPPRYINGPSHLPPPSEPEETPEETLPGMVGTPLPHRLGEMWSFAELGKRGTDAVFTPDAAFVLGGSEDTTVRLWDVQTSTERRFDGTVNGVVAVDVSTDGQRVLAVDGKTQPPSLGMVHVWDVASGKSTHEIQTTKAQLAWDACFSPNGSFILLACQDASLRLLELEEKSIGEVLQYGGHEAPVRSAAFTADGQKIVSGGDDATVRIWNRTTGAELAKLSGHDGAVLSVDVASDGSFAVSGGKDKTVRIWDLRKNKLLHTLNGHTNDVTAVAVSPDGEFVLSASKDSTIRLWKASSGIELHHFSAHLGGVHSIAFSADGRTAVSSGEDAAVRVWGLPEPGDFPAEIDVESSDEDQADDPPAKLPLPDKQAQKSAETRVRDVYKADLAAADTPPERAALVNKLLSEGVKPQSDPVTTYALLRVAWSEATKAGAIEAALRAVDEIDQRFTIDPAWAKAKTIQSLAAGITNETQSRILMAECLAVVDQALDVDGFAAARQILATADNLAKTARDGNLRSRIAARLEDVAAGEQKFQGIKQALATLETQPDDPAASETVGRYACFQRGDWAKGLPRLTAGADKSLAKLAATDLAEPEEAAQRFALANAWWNVAEQQTGRARANVRARAAHWYRLAEPELANFDQTQARQRLAEAGAASSSRSRSFPLPKSSGFDCRKPEVKVDLLLALGGNDQSEAAVARALKWIESEQQPNGYWTFTLDGPRGKSKSPNPGTLDKAPVAATALALLPLLAAGNSARHGEYRQEVVAGLTFLRLRLMASSSMVSHLTPRGGMLYEPDAGQMPSHALATIALCEASALAGDPQSKQLAQAAVNFILATQNQDGGWSFDPDLRDPNSKPQTSDVYSTAWNLAALKSAGWAGLSVPSTTLEPAGKFLDSMYLGEEEGYCRSDQRRRSDPTATAAAIMSRMYLGWPRDQQELVQYANYIGELDPPDGSEFYRDLYHVQILREVRGSGWPAYSEATRDWLIAAQQAGGSAAGSWYFPGTGWSVTHGGRLFCTAVATLMLQTYYRNPLLYPPR